MEEIMKIRSISLVAIIVVLLSCESHFEKSYDFSGLTFSEYLDRTYSALLKTYPEMVTELGLDRELGLDGRELDNWDEDFLKQREKLEREILSGLDGYDPGKLTEEDEISYHIYRYYIEDLVEGQKFRHHNYLVHYMLTGINVSTEQFFTEIIPVNSPVDAEKYISRLKAVLPKMKQIERQLEIQEEKGIILPLSLSGAALNSLRSVSRQKPSNCTFYTAFEKKLTQAGIDEARKRALLTEAEEACRESVIPGYKLLENKLISQQTSAPGETGVVHLPDGKAFYEYALKHHSSSTMSPREIHETGLEELRNIHEEMKDLFGRLGYDKSFTVSELYRNLERNNQKLSGNEVVEEHRRLISEAMDWMKGYFSQFPPSGIEVKADSFGGFYIPPSYDNSRPGVFYASTGTVGSFTLPTLTFHETYPGHHYQISLAGSMDLPLFRRQAFFTGYLEGWALYSEYLMDETGYYGDDIPARLGYLQAQAFRAARLVVDTGLHLYGWDMGKATEFFMENTGFDKGFSTNQVYRYLVWPGQAASYYSGFLELRNILDEEKSRRGDRFDYKSHHDRIINNGPMPLAILKEEIFPNE